MSEIKLPRLLQAAKDFNVGQQTLIDFLVSKGFEKDDLNLSAKVHKLTIDKDGNIHQNWPTGFFDEFRNKLDELIW